LKLQFIFTNKKKIAAATLIIAVLAYVGFWLFKTADKINVVLKDVATKNPSSQGNLLVFEIKRDKKAETVINNIAAVEIFGRLMEQDADDANQKPNIADLNRQLNKTNHK
jgi:hypothetical protein